MRIDLNGINMDGIEQLGTALSKQTLLTDDVAESIGLASADPTVNEALDMLRQRIQGIGANQAVLEVNVCTSS